MCNLQKFAVFAIGARFYHRAVKVSNSVQVIVVCMVPWASSPPFVDACADAAQTAQTAQTSGSNAGKHIEREGENLRMIGNIPISLGNRSILMGVGCFVDFPESHV
jgi:hypothetical protein